MPSFRNRSRGFESLPLVRGINACDLADSPSRQLRTDPQPRASRRRSSKPSARLRVPKSPSGSHRSARAVAGVVRGLRRNPSPQTVRDAVSARVSEGRVMTDRVARQSRQGLFKCRLSRSAGPARRLPATHTGTNSTCRSCALSAGQLRGWRKSSSIAGSCFPASASS
jgi:hypothetical protein